MARNTNTNSTRSIDQVSANVAALYATQPTDTMSAEELEEGYALYCDIQDRLFPDFDSMEREAQHDARQFAYNAWLEAMQRIEGAR